MTAHARLAASAARARVPQPRATVVVLDRGSALGSSEKAISGGVSSDADDLKWPLQRGQAAQSISERRGGTPSHVDMVDGTYHFHQIGRAGTTNVAWVRRP
jgi:hypothetical protein